MASYPELLTRLKPGDSWLCVGDDAYSRHALVQRLLVKLQLSGHSPSFFRGEVHQLALALDHAMAAPMLAVSRLVVVDNSQNLTDALLLLLLKYLAAPSRSTLLLLLATKALGRPKIVALTKAKLQIVQLNADGGQTLTTKLQQKAQLYGKQLDPQAAVLLVAAVGEDGFALQQALHVAALYVGEQSVITPQDVGQLFHGTTQVSIFALTDALGQQSFAAQCQLLECLMHQQHVGLVILNLLVRQLRLLLQTVGLQGRNLATVLKLPAFVAQRLSQQAQAFTQRGLACCLGAAVQAEIKLKNSNIKAYLLLAQLLLAIEECRMTA